jgi:hypothetical protein
MLYSNIRVLHVRVYCRIIFTEFSNLVSKLNVFYGLIGNLQDLYDGDSCNKIITLIMNLNTNNTLYN